MAKRRRKRLKWYAGGSLVLILALILGDPYGMFRTGEGPETGTRVASGFAPRDKENEPIAAGKGTKVAERASPQPALMDQAMGIIHRYEQAIGDDRLVDLATLVDEIRRQPITVPEQVAERWKRVQASATEALAFGRRLRGMLKKGEVLAAHKLIAPILAAATPDWLRDVLDKTARDHGWPALTRKWKLVAGSVKADQPDTDLARLRRVRFVKDGVVQEGQLWRCSAAEATVRMGNASGYTYPVVRRYEIEPVEPQRDEALRQGIAVAAGGDALAVALWSCHLHERGDQQRAQRLRRLIE